MVKLHKEPKDNSICAHDMADGRIAVVTQWPDVPSMIGKIVQRYGEELMNIGEYYGAGRGDFFKHNNRNEDIRVRLLQKGELIEIC